MRSVAWLRNYANFINCTLHQYAETRKKKISGDWMSNTQISFCNIKFKSFSEILHVYFPTFFSFLFCLGLCIKQRREKVRREGKKFFKSPPKVVNISCCIKCETLLCVWRCREKWIKSYPPSRTISFLLAFTPRQIVVWKYDGGEEKKKVESFQKL